MKSLARLFFAVLLTVHSQCTLSADNSTDTNLLCNSSFEFPELVPPQNQAPGADDWITFNSAGVRTAFRHSLRQCLRLAPNAPTGTGHGIARQEFEVGTDVQLNEVYSMGAWILNSSSDPLTGDRIGQLRIQWFNASGNLVNQAIQDVADASMPTDEWTFVSLENVLLPNNANITDVRVSLFVLNNGGTGGGPLFIDDVRFVQGETVSMGGDPELLNPGFELPEIVPPATSSPGADDWVTFNTAGVRNTQQHTGAQSLRLAPNAPTGTGVGIARQEFIAGQDFLRNEVYSMGAWIFINPNEPLTGTRKGQLRLQWYNEAGTLINQSIVDAADSTTPVDEWIFVALENVLIPNNPNIFEVRAALFVTNDGGTGGGPVFFDDVTLVRGPTAVMGGGPTTVIPDSFVVTRGNYVQGTEVELSTSDNEDLSARRSSSDVQSRVHLEVKSTSPTETPTSIEFNFEGSVFARTAVTQSIDLWDYSIQDWEEVDSRNASRFVDSSATIIPTGDLSRFVEAGTGCTQARVRFRSLSPRQQFSANVDLTTWTFQ